MLIKAAASVALIAPPTIDVMIDSRCSALLYAANPTLFTGLFVGSAEP